ncbi:MAG TPA: MarR family transcriptional regulator [Thermoanaerobaculia bacterium]|nr:MarR family transcriptional regulator [Thermoanaerobaculia bacterium]
MHRASRQIALRLEWSCRQLGVSPQEGHLLTYLGSYAPAPVGELRRVFGHKGSTLTSLLDRLSAAGLASRRPNPADRRSVLVETTAGGERVAAVLRIVILALEGEILRRVQPADLEGFRAVMAAIEDVTRVDPRKESEDDRTAHDPGAPSPRDPRAAADPAGL